MSPANYDTNCVFCPEYSSQSKRVLWEITHKCNLGCPHCHVDKDKPDVLTLPDIERIMKQLYAFGVRNIIFSGGEPFLRKDLLDIFELAVRSGFSIDFCTNGTLVSYSKACELTPYLKDVSVSIDGHEAGLHGKIRGGTDTFEQTLAGIRNLQKAGHEVHLICVTNKENMAYIRPIVELGYHLGAKSTSLQGLVKHNPRSFELALSRQEREEVLKLVRQLRCEYGDKFPINTKRLSFTPPLDRCPAGDVVLGISASGFLSPCIFIRAYLEPLNLRSRSLDEAVNSDPFQSVLKQYADIECAGCDLTDVCGKGCIGTSWLLGRGIGPDVECSHVK